MNNDTTETPSSSRQESLESFRPQITGDGNAGGSQENLRKKRKLALALAGDHIPSHFNGPPKPKPGKKPKLGAPNITTPCSVCGKQFWSWKALFGHMRCHPERQWRGINPPSNFRQLVSPESPAEGLGVKFTKEDHEVATCLVLLSNGRTAMNSPCSMVDRGRLVSGDSIEELLITRDADGAGPSGLNCRFECLSCKRVFGSRQALGGHRASHKNIKGCFAIARNGDGEDEDRNGNDTGGEGEVKEAGEEKMGMVLGHKCSICLRVFSSGQALGGHKRCHWEKEDEPPLHGLNPFIRREGCGLDLNLPAPTENDRESSSSSSGLALDLRLGL